MGVQIYRRRIWHPRGGTGTPQSGATELYIHHSAGFDRQARSAAEQAAILRDIERLHISPPRNWAGIAYNFLGFQPHGRLRSFRIWEGRGWNRIPAAQLNHNEGTIALCVIDPLNGELFKSSGKRELIQFAIYARKHHGIERLGGHKDAPGQSTECPGGFIYPHLDDIAEAAKLDRIRR
jgi:hypothetical protein